MIGDSREGDREIEGSVLKPGSLSLSVISSLQSLECRHQLRVFVTFPSTETYTTLTPSRGYHPQTVLETPKPSSSYSSRPGVRIPNPLPLKVRADTETGGITFRLYNCLIYFPFSVRHLFLFSPNSFSFPLLSYFSFRNGDPQQTRDDMEYRKWYRGTWSLGVPFSGKTKIS